MASQLDIATICCTILGKAPPTSIFPSDGSNVANTIAGLYNPLRQALLQGPGIWRFSVKRTSLAASSTIPASGPFTTQFPLPIDYLRALQIGDMYAGLDLSDYRQGPTDADYSVEGGFILCDYGSPLSLQYVYDVQDTGLFDPNFVIAFAAEIAFWACERLTGSNDKQKLAQARRDEAKSNALAASALVNAPAYPADDTFILARMQ